MCSTLLLVADLPWTYLLSHSIILPPLSLVLFLTTLSSLYFEPCSHIVVLSSSPAGWLTQCGFVVLNFVCVRLSQLLFCVRPSQSVISRASSTLRGASTCATRSCIYCLYLYACTICSIASLLSLWCVPLFVSVPRWMICRRLLASLTAISHTIQATHSQCHTLLNSYNMARPPLLRSHLLQYRRLMFLHPQVLFPAHCYHAVHSAHKSLRLPPVMAQEVSCRSLKRSRSSHSLSFYSAAESQLLLLSRLNLQFPSQFWRLLCRRLHFVTSPRMCLRRRLINRTRFCVMWPFRRLSMAPLPYHWMLLRRRPHLALRLSMSLRRWVLAQLPRFLLIRLCRFLHIVLCNLTLPHNLTSLSSSLAGFTQTDLLIVGILFVSPRHQY